MTMLAAPLRDLDTASDGELICGMAGRDAEASTVLFRRFRAAMLAAARRISSDPALAEDATQDACLQAWRNADRYDPARGSVWSWLHVMVRGRTLDRLRARQIRQDAIRPGLDPDTVRSNEPAVDAVEFRDRIRVVDAALDLLPRPEAKAIKLAYYEGLTHTEIATLLDVPLGTAKTQLRRGMQLLRTAVDDRPRRPFQMGAPALAAASRTAPLANLRILVVDDEPDTIRLTTVVLRRAGASVVPAASANEAMQRLDTIWPDVALIDLGMPDADGYTVMARVYAIREKHARRLPAVAFTALASSRDRDETRAAGFALHVAKPIGPARLVDAVASVAHG